MLPVENASRAPLPAVCHCLLIETDTDGLVLVDTGFGTVNVDHPVRSLGADFLGWAAPVLDPAETAVRQLVRLGHAPSDVRHVVPTHLHRDHSGGLPDFPEATIHVHRDEYAAATSGPSAAGYPREHWAHGPRWEVFGGDDPGGDRWHGFDGVRRPSGVSAPILLVPLSGHTPGQVGVAVETPAGWLLHAGDTYYLRTELEREAPPEHPLLGALQRSVETDRALRLSNVERLRRLVGAEDSGVRVVSAHDPWEFAAA